MMGGKLTPKQVEGLRYYEDFPNESARGVLTAQTVAGLAYRGWLLVHPDDGANVSIHHPVGISYLDAGFVLSSSGKAALAAHEARAPLQAPEA